MCTSFIAKNFRAFEEIKIQKLAKVNLFLGKNSVGKTALLEALYIHLHSNKMEAIKELLVKKDEHLSDESDVSSVGDIVRHLFHNNQLSDFDKEGVVLGELTKKGEPNKNKLTEIKTAVKNDDEVLQVVKNKISDYALLRGDFGDFGDFYRYRRMRGRRAFQHESTSDKKRVLRFVYSSGSSDIVKMWDKIDLTGKKDKVIEALQIIEPNLIGVKFEVQGNNERIAKASINNKIVLLKSMGDGINRILYIVLSMVNAENGYLLIDEFENGLHYSVQKQLWEIIFSLAEYLNVQVFATTHSSDCIKAFDSQWKDNQENATMYRIDFYKNKHSVMPYDFEELNSSLYTQTEVR